MFQRAGYRAGTISISKAELAAEYGADPRSAVDWIKQLVESGLVEKVYSFKGTYHLYIHEPESAEQPQRVAADPQTELEFDDGQLGESVQIPPGESAQIPPDVLSLHRPESENSAEVTAKPPDRKVGESAQGPPARLHGNHRKVQTTSEPCAMEQPGSHGSMEGKLERALLGEIDRARSRERKRINTGENLKPISGAVVDAINNLCDATQPEALKRQLVDRVMRERWKDFHPAIAGRCADAVLDGGITKKQFRDFIKEANDVGRNPGAYFQSKCRKECESAPNPVPWRDGKSKGRASE